MKKINISVKRSKARVTWGFSPITRIVKSKKIYSRKNYKVEY